MLPYIIVFIVATGLTYVGQKVLRTNRSLGISLFVISILIVSIFAAIRDYGVGTDLLAHKTKYFDTALSQASLPEYLAFFKEEYLFGTLSYFIAHTFGSMRVLMFIMTCVPLCVLYFYCIKKNPKYIALGLAVYLLMFFNTSLNVIRQVMAISCTIPAFFSLQENKIIRSLLLIIAGLLFHSSAILMLILFPINYFSKKEKQYKYYLIVLLLFVLLCVSIKMLPSTQITSLLIGDYSNYLKIETTNLNTIFLFVKIVFFAFVTYFYKFYKNDSLCRNFYYFAILDTLFYFFSNFVMFGYRLSYYFVVFYPFFIPSIAEKLKGKDKAFFCGVIAMLLVLYWFDRNIAIGYDGTIPYLIGEELW